MVVGRVQFDNLAMTRPDLDRFMPDLDTDSFGLEEIMLDSVAGLLD